MGFSFLGGVLIPFFTDWGHISLTQIQILQSWFMLWVFILQIPTGAIADMLGRKYTLALGAFMGASATLIYGSIPNFQIFLVAEFLFAASVALISGANEAMLYDTLKERGEESKSKQIFGRAHAWRLGGIMIAAPIGSAIAHQFGLNYPMLFTSIPFFAAMLVALNITEPKIHGKFAAESTNYLKIAKEGFIYFYQHKVLRLIAIDAIVVASAAYFVIWLYQSLLKDIGVPIIYFGIAHALFLAAEILVTSNFSLLIKLFGSDKNMLKFSAFSTSFSFILAAAFPSIWTIALLLIFAGGFGLTRIELMGAYMNRLIPSRQRATVLSSISMFRNLALVLLNPLVGFAADHSLSLALLLVGIIPLTVFLFSPVEQGMLDEE